MIVLDACVLIAFVDPTDACHGRACRTLDTTEPMCISALTGAELMVRPVNNPNWRWVDLLSDLSIEVVPITAEDMPVIAAARRESGLKMPDALIVWLARARGATIATFDQHLLATAARLGVHTVSE